MRRITTPQRDFILPKIYFRQYEIRWHQHFANGLFLYHFLDLPLIF